MKIGQVLVLALSIPVVSLLLLVLTLAEQRLTSARPRAKTGDRIRQNDESVRSGDRKMIVWPGDRACQGARSPGGQDTRKAGADGQSRRAG